MALSSSTYIQQIYTSYAYKKMMKEWGALAPSWGGGRQFFFLLPVRVGCWWMLSRFCCGSVFIVIKIEIS